MGSVTLAGEQRDIFVHSQAADESNPSDIGNLELPVSQLQQQNAQKKASDKLADEQKAFTKEQQRVADDATSDQSDELLKQHSKLQQSRSDSLDQLRKTKHQLQATQAELARLKANPPRPSPPNPAATPVPVTSDQLAQQQRMQQWTQQVTQLTAAVTQTEQGINQIEASIDQTDESIKQLDKQMDALDEQTQQTAEQRAKQEKLQDKQEALDDVRANPVKVKDVAKVGEVMAPTTVTQIEGTPSVTITATPEASDLGALSATIQSRLDSITDLPPGVTATLGGAAENQREAFSQLGLAMLVAIALVFMIMVGTFRSLVQPLILMVSIPFAATGAIAGSGVESVIGRIGIGVDAPVLVGVGGRVEGNTREAGF